MAAPQRGEHVGRWDAALGQQDEGVVEEIGGLAGEGGASLISGRGRVVLGGEQQFGGLLGDLATDRVDAALEQAGRVGARRALLGA